MMALVFVLPYFSRGVPYAVSGVITLKAGFISRRFLLIKKNAFNVISVSPPVPSRL
jgi:hypothetical protein